MDSSQTNQDIQDWDVLITPRQGAWHIDLKSLWQFRDLIWLFFKRDFVAFYKQTVLGPIWYLIQPLLTAFTYYIVFGRIANLPTSGLPPFLFYLSGIVLWGYFSTCLTSNSEIFAKNASLFGKVYFPRLVVPISVAMSGLVAFSIQFSLLLLVTAGYAVSLEGFHFAVLGLLALPVLVFYVALLGVGVGLIVSAMTVRFRDLAFAIGFVTQLWMYATPIVYPYAQIPEKYQWFFYLNPMTAPIETFKQVLFSTGGVSLDLWLVNLTTTIILLILGVVMFSWAEKIAMDTV